MLGESWTVLKILQWTADYLGQKGVEEGRLDAELLLAAALGLDRVGLYLNYDRPLNPDELACYRGYVGRRARREPVQYILGRTEFWSLPFRVTPATLVPRADTEVLVEEALKRTAPSARVLDVGTGSGAIAVALAKECPRATIQAVDVCPEALDVAAENARLNGVAERIAFAAADIAELPGGPFDLIVSNPPYIPEADMAGLMPEVGDYEPRLALCGGEDGLDAYRLLAQETPSRLRPGGWLLLEVGIDQAGPVEELLATTGFRDVFIREDYAGIPRVVGGKTPGAAGNLKKVDGKAIG